MLIARTTEVGARNLVWAATQETPSGAYVEDCKVSRYVPLQPFSPLAH